MYSDSMLKCSETRQQPKHAAFCPMLPIIWYLLLVLKGCVLDVGIGARGSGIDNPQL